ncbi:MAG: 5-formyltetrahydrofolate cyclo-ligase [Pacificimonas sp.]
MRAARAAEVASLSSAERVNAAAALASRIKDAVMSCTLLGSYAPMGNEIDPGAIERLAPRDVLLPWFADRGAAMTYRRVGDVRELGPFGVAQPKAAMALETPDLILVPLVGATTAGDRIGQGQGHFDRYLRARRAEGDCIAIGLAWDSQIVDMLPTDPWDEPLDMIATPSSLYRRT